MSVSEDTNLNFNLVILSYEIDSKLNPSKDLEQNAEQNEDIIENKEQSVTVYIVIYTLLLECIEKNIFFIFQTEIFDKIPEYQKISNDSQLNESEEVKNMSFFNST